MRSRLSRFKSSHAKLLLFAAIACLGGCGTGNYPVSGTITLDNQPLADASVSFVSTVEDGPIGVGHTDNQGKFTIEDEWGNPGIPPGEFEVRVSTYMSGDPAAEPPLPSVRERVPEKYNIKTTLKETIEAKSEGNVFEFKLDSRR